jgi:hypothetical protein
MSTIILLLNALYMYMDSKQDYQFQVLQEGFGGGGWGEGRHVPVRGNQPQGVENPCTPPTPLNTHAHTHTYVLKHAHTHTRTHTHTHTHTHTNTQTYAVGHDNTMSAMWVRQIECRVKPIHGHNAIMNVHVQCVCLAHPLTEGWMAEGYYIRQWHLVAMFGSLKGLGQQTGRVTYMEIGWE